MKNTIDLKKFLVENKLTENSRLLVKEEWNKEGGTQQEYEDMNIEIYRTLGSPKSLQDVNRTELEQVINGMVDRNWKDQRQYKMDKESLYRSAYNSFTRDFKDIAAKAKTSGTLK